MKQRGETKGHFRSIRFGQVSGRLPRAEPSQRARFAPKLATKTPRYKQKALVVLLILTPEQ